MSTTEDNALAPELALRAAMARIYYGACLCGDVGYRVSGTPLRMVQCAGSVFVPVKQFRWTRGETQIVSYRLPVPGAPSTAFCRRCGGDLPRPSKGEVLLVVPANALECQSPEAQAAAGEAAATVAQAHVCTEETLNRVPPFV